LYQRTDQQTFSGDNMTAAIATTAKAIAFGAEAVVDFFMISKFAAPVFVVGVMAFFGFGLPAIFSLFA
jgi:hypothetical protein